jgi:hypothetical protein
MKKVIDKDGLEWEINKYGVIMRIGKEDVIKGCNEIIFANMEKERELRSSYPDKFPKWR